MATLEEMVDGVRRDLSDEVSADPGAEVFTTLQVEDFIRGGIADLNRVAPSDTTYELPLIFDNSNGTGYVTTFQYDVPIELPYRVEWFRFSDGWAEVIPEGVEGQSAMGGFDFKRTATGGTITFPMWWLGQLNGALHGVRLHGYAARPLPYTIEGEESPSISLSTEEEYSVRAYARSAGFDLLAHDRSLFAQWQGQTNNTDVSPTQMMQMAQNAKQEWDRQRGLIRTIRKYW